jgi:hypothetical protein
VVAVSTLRGIGDWDELAAVVTGGTSDVSGIPGALASIEPWADGQAAGDATAFPIDEIEEQLRCADRALSSGG